MPRRFTRFPPGARKHLEAMAANGLLSKVRAADALGMPLDQFNEVLESHAPSRKVWEQSLSIECDVILDAMFQRAVDGDVSAQRTLLAVRHGLSERDSQGHTGGVTLNLNLPAAMSAKDYLDAITIEPESLPNDSAAS